MLRTGLCLIVGFGLICAGASGLSISSNELAGLRFDITEDVSDDQAGNNFAVYGLGHAISDGFLYVVVQTDLPQAGLANHDSYGYNLLSPGDLYVNVGGTFQNGGGSSYGIATTTHGNIVPQAYGNQSWTQVQAGNLYSNATFADGTFENYQDARPNFDVDDGDGDNLLNSYPTLIRFGTEVGGDVSGVDYSTSASGPGEFDIFYKVRLASLGIVDGVNVQLFWAMECGNDGAEHFLQTKPVIPEPTTVALLTAGISAMAVRGRNNKSV